MKNKFKMVAVTLVMVALTGGVQAQVLTPEKIKSLSSAEVRKHLFGGQSILCSLAGDLIATTVMYRNNARNTGTGTIDGYKLIEEVEKLTLTYEAASDEFRDCAQRTKLYLMKGSMK